MLEEMEQIATKAIRQAGDLVRRHIGNISARHIQNKGPSDYVTEIDTHCEKLIIETIHARFPDHRIMAEESPHVEWSEETTWIIDPLDGTTNFINGFPFVAVSIALCIKREVVLGLVLDPVRDELFTARRDGGAFLNGSPMHVKPQRDRASALIATGFPFRARQLVEPYLNTFRSIFREVSDIRRAGSAALDLAYVAAGRVDGFWEIGLKPWDVAAGSLLILEAGGQVDDFWGTGQYLSNGHLVAGTASVHAFLMDRVQKHLAAAVRSSDGESECEFLDGEWPKD